MDFTSRLHSLAIVRGLKHLGGCNVVRRRTHESTCPPWSLQAAAADDSDVEELELPKGDVSTTVQVGNELGERECLRVPQPFFTFVSALTRIVL